jgi:hypothetical protein
MSEWQMRLDWSFRLKKHCDRIRSGIATHEDYDMFWIKFWGLLEEFSQPFKEQAVRFEQMNDINSEIYAPFSDERRSQLFAFYKQNEPSNIQLIIASLYRVHQKVEVVRQSFSKEEIFLAYDYRTHICHPVSSFYRLRINRSGKLLDECRGLSKAEVQEILKSQFHRFRNLGRPDEPNENAARYFVSKIADSTLSEIQRAAFDAVLGMYPSLALLAYR